MEVNKIGNVYSSKYTGGNFAGNVYDKYGLSPTILTFKGGGRQPHIIEEVMENDGQNSKIRQYPKRDTKNERSE